MIIMERKEKQKIMYLYTAITTIPFGISILIVPNLWFFVTDLTSQNQYIFGIVGCIWIAFGICSLVALKHLNEFSPILLMQFLYKTIWLFGVFLPQIFTSGISIISLILMLVFLTYIIPDLFLISWRTLLK